MDQINKIDKLIEIGEKITWNECSREKPEHNATYGLATPAWNTWISRIGNVLRETVKENSEPFVYFKSAYGSNIDGNLKDKFDFAKENFLKALYKVKELMMEGDVFDELLKPLFAPIPTVQQVSENAETKSSKKVFIVHGHDHKLKIELEIFLAHIGLEAVVLHREADGGQTVIEKFEANSDVAFAFILLTPDEITYTLDQIDIKDEDRKKESRARPNVIFEFGYFVAKLTRQRVCALLKGDVEVPSDLQGLIYKKVDTSIEEIGFTLIKELKAAGLKPEI